MLVRVNRALAARLGVRHSPLWQGPDPRHLSAPTEVHVVLSRRCSAGCRLCYVAATPRGEVLDPSRACRILDNLAAAGVFHVALGGGEALDLPHLFDLAEHARRVGLVPNLTVSGAGMTEALARRCGVFGRIHVSVDGPAEVHRRTRATFEQAEAAVRRLRAQRRGVGLNCVVTRENFDRLDDLAAMARRWRLREVELLRFKAAGRGAGLDLDLLPDQARALYPLVRRLSLRHALRIRLDCSFAPMVFAHAPLLSVARFFGVVGCAAGDMLAAVMPDGSLRGCSFAGPPEADAADAASLRNAFSKGFGTFRDPPVRRREPCASCDYVSLCNGGCCVPAAATGDPDAPDPGCPRVHERSIGRFAAALLVAFAAFSSACPETKHLQTRCVTDADCGTARSCDAATGTCRCVSDAACSPDEFCNGRSCQRRVGCDTTLDCPPGTFCDLGTRQCVDRDRCTSDVQCPIGAVCDEVRLECIAGCRDNGDCRLGEACECPGGADAGPCRIGACRAGVCADDSFCRYGERCVEDDDGERVCRRDERGPYCQGCQYDPASPTRCPGADDGANFCLLDRKVSWQRTYCGVDCDAGQPCPWGYQCRNILVLTRALCHADAECPAGGRACASDADCPGARCDSASGRCAGRCSYNEDSKSGFCTCTTDTECPRETCDSVTWRCSITRRPCTPGGTECDRAIRCVPLGDRAACFIGRNCVPAEGLTCEDVRAP